MLKDPALDKIWLHALKIKFIIQHLGFVSALQDSIGLMEYVKEESHAKRISIGMVINVNATLALFFLVENAEILLIRSQTAHLTPNSTVLPVHVIPDIMNFLDSCAKDAQMAKYGMVQSVPWTQIVQMAWFIILTSEDAIQKQLTAGIMQIGTELCAYVDSMHILLKINVSRVLQEPHSMVRLAIL